MPDKENTKRINRRKFLQNSAKLTAAGMLTGMGTSRLFGAVTGNLMGEPVARVTLNNGAKMPVLGFGTLTLNNEKGANCVADAISVGYRLIDTATVYGNEVAVGKGIKLSGIDRKELFVTSKVWVEDSGYEKAKKAFETSLNKLQLDYLDLYLIHRPRGDVHGSWKAMEELYREGKIKAIGVSNFTDVQIKDLMDNFDIKPAVNQIETHAFFQQPADHKFLEDIGIQHEAWSPLAQGRNNHFSNETLAEVGKKYGKNIAQVALRRHHQRGIIPIPRSSQKAHMKENLNIFDFELSDMDIKKIEKLDLNITQFPEWE